MQNRSYLIQLPSCSLTSNLLWSGALGSKHSFHPGASETERKLHQKLFQNYNLKVRPARYWEDKVMVRVGMTLSQLVSLVNIGAGRQNPSWPSCCVCTASLTSHSSLPAPEREERGDDDQRVHESGTISATSVFITRPRTTALTHNADPAPPPPAPTLTAAFPPSPLLCSQMDLSLPITQKPTRCFIYRLLWLVRSCPSLAPAN